MIIPPTFRCPLCNSNNLLFEPKWIVNYFKKEIVVCPECEEYFDLFEAASDQIFLNFMNSYVYNFLGAKSKICEVDIKESDVTTIDLVSLGIPETARLIHLNYTPYGNVWPLDMHTNEPLRVNHGLKRIVRGVKLDNDAAVREPKLSVLATFIDQADETYESIQHLLEAFVHYSEGNYASAIIPANVAVELSLSHLMYNVFDNIVKGEKLKRFFNDAATYSHQLNVLYPYVAAKEGYEQINDTMRGSLNRLRSLRNEVAHNGSKNLNLDKKEMSKLLASALFVNVYLNHLLKSSSLNLG